MLDQASRRNESDMLMLESENTTILNFEAGNPFISDSGMKLERSKEKGLELLSRTGAFRTMRFFDPNLPSLAKATARELSKSPNNPYFANNLGLALLAEGRYDEAKTQFQKAIDMAGDSYSAKMNFARTLLYLGVYDDALTIYKELETERPDDTRILMNMAHVYFVLRRFTESHELLNKVVTLDQNDAAAHNNRAVIHMVEARFDEAIRDLRKAVSISTRFATAQNNLGVCYAVKAAPRKAIKHFQTALSIDPRNGGVAENLALSFYALGDYKRTAALLERYLRMNRSDVSARELLAKTLLTMGRYNACHEHLDLAFRIAKQKYENESQYDFSHFHNNFGVMYHCRRNLTKARELYLKAKAESNSPSKVFYQNLIDLYLEMGKLDLAEKELKEARTYFPKSGPILFRYSQYYFRLGRIEEAKETLEMAIREEPAFIASYALLSFIHSEMTSDYAAATGILEKGLRYGRTSRPLLNNLAYNFLMQNDIEKARAILDSVRSGAEDVFITATRGLLLLKENNVQEGLSLYNRAASLAIGNSPLREQVRQKKNLELARYHSSQGKTEVAVRYLRRVLKSTLKSSVYYAQGVRLAESLGLSRQEAI